MYDIQMATKHVFYIYLGTFHTRNRYVAGVSLYFSLAFIYLRTHLWMNGKVLFLAAPPPTHPVARLHHLLVFVLVFFLPLASVQEATTSRGRS